MKLLTILRNRFHKNSLKNSRGQGATEYILLLVVVVGLVMLFGPKIKSAMSSKMEALDTDMGKVNNN